MAEERAEGVRTAVKRRGLIAGAAALVAGIAAKQASRPVAADNGTWQFPYSGEAASSGALIRVTNDDGINPASIAIRGESVGNGMGLLGASNTGRGVAGSSTSGIGVAGVSGSATITAAFKLDVGVVGAGGNAGTIGISAAAGTSGVVGFANGYIPPVGIFGGTVGVSNQAALPGVSGYHGGSGAGVRGESASGTGVYGIVSGGTTAGTMGIYGANTSTAPNSHGIIGLSQHGHGLIGTCNAHPAAGNTYAGLVGLAGVPDANAGNFYGNVAVAGNLIVTGNQTAFGAKSAALAHPDGSHRLVYCVEAPESWLEDFGEGTLAGGKAEVKLDPDFTAVADMAKYHVFLTHYSEAGNGANVIQRRADGFSVQEQNKGTGRGTFSWRVVAKRKDVKAGRLAKFDLPKLTPPTIPAPHIADLPSTPPVPPKGP